MTSDQEEQSEVKPPKILRGRVDSFALYEITDAELNILESGSPSSLHLNFSVFFLSIASSFLIALLTSSVSSRVFTVFVVVTVVGLAVGLFLFFLWFRARRSISTVVRRIRARIPGDMLKDAGEQAEEKECTPVPPASRESAG